MNNLGTTDRLVRLVAGLVLLVLGWSGAVDGLAGTILKFLGFVPLATALIGFCPAYLPLGLSTRKKA